MKIAPPFGIDLGTTRTAAAVFLPDSSEPSVATVDGGAPTIPSVIATTGDGRWHVGDDAIDTSRTADAPLVESVKRHMGSTEPVRHGRDLSPEDVSAIILSAITERMRRHLEVLRPDVALTPRDAVITVPAYFDAPQIEATRRAGELAGLRVAGLVQEPTAAAIYHTWKNDLGDGTFLVYDLGGGTFDVSIIRALYGEYQVLSIDGDNHLGGDDFDRRLADRLRSDLIDAGYDLGGLTRSDEDLDIFETLRRIARRIKEELSDSDVVEVDEENIFADRSGRSVDLKTSISREDFEELVDDLIESTILACRIALETAQNRHDLDRADVDGIFLVGGSTRVPAVRRRLLDDLGPQLEIDDEQVFADEPETSVARGAALHAAAVAPLRFESDDVVISITDLPSDNPSRRLIGQVECGEKDRPTEIAFGIGGEEDDARNAALEPGDGALRFSISEFDALDLEPRESPLVSTTLRRNGEVVFGPHNLWLPPRPKDARQPPTLALTNPAVLAKDINIEIVESGKPAHYTLIDRGTHLPTTARRRLFTADRSDSLVLRLFQHRLPIHTLVLQLPEDTPPGTAVELTVDVDQAMNTTASGSVEEQKFWARIDRPSTPRRWQWDEIEEMMDRTAEIEERLWGVEARRFADRRRNLFAGIRAAVRHDSHRLQVLARRLESLLEEYAPRPKRTPGRDRVETLLDAIRRLVFAADDDRLGRGHDEWIRRLDKWTTEVDEAWKSDDDAHWKALADRIQATYESLAQDEFLYRRRDPEIYARTLLDTTNARLQNLHQDAADFPYDSEAESRRLQKSEVESIADSLESLRARVPTPPVNGGDVSKLKRLARTIDHLERRLERVHTLGVPRRGDQS